MPNVADLLMYNLVAVIEAEDLHDAFEIGNVGPESKINRIGPMRSLSVGDCLLDMDDHRMWIVRNVGFHELKLVEGDDYDDAMETGS